MADSPTEPRRGGSRSAPGLLSEWRGRFRGANLLSGCSRRENHIRRRFGMFRSPLGIKPPVARKNVAVGRETEFFRSAVNPIRGSLQFEEHAHGRLIERHMARLA